MHKVFIQAQEVRAGDTIAFAAPMGHFLIERVTRPTHGRVELLALNESHRFIYAPTDRIRVLLGDDRAVAGDESAAIEADIAIARMKQAPAWDEARFSAANQREFQESFSRANTGGLWA